MIVDKYGRVAGSIDLATLAQMYEAATDADLKDHYRQVAAENGVDLGEVSEAAVPEVAAEPEPEPEPSEPAGLYDSMSKQELQDELASRSLATSGNKDELVARLEEDDGT